VVELINGTIVTGPPKSASGVRWVSIPPFLLPDVVERLDQFTGTGDDNLVSTGPKGAQLRRSNFTRQWRKALEAAGLTGIEPALSAWESVPSGPVTCPDLRFGCT
jgi:integrase